MDRNKVKKIILTASLMKAIKKGRQMATPQGVGKHGSNSETRAMVLLRRNRRPLSLIRNDKKAAEGLKRK